jgi:2-dehydropantoate 2-reductase
MSAPRRLRVASSAPARSAARSARTSCAPATTSPSSTWWPSTSRPSARDGLRIEGPIDAFTVRAPAYGPHEVPGRFETVFLCVKAQATEAAARGLLPVPGRRRRRGVAAERPQRAGHRRGGGARPARWAASSTSAPTTSPPASSTTAAAARSCSASSTAPRRRAWRRARRRLDFEPNAIVSRNIWGYLWSKLAVGAMIFATALTDDGIADCYAMPAYRPLFAAIAREVLAVALARGVTPEPFDGFDPARSCRASPTSPSARSTRWWPSTGARPRPTAACGATWRCASAGPRARPSSARSCSRRRALGGIAVGRPAPLVTRILEMVREVEEGDRERSRANLDELDALRSALRRDAPGAPS